MNELRYYLELLLEHQCASGPDKCVECRSLQRICQYLQTELFSSVIYNKIPMESGQVIPTAPSRRAANLH